MWILNVISREIFHVILREILNMNSRELVNKISREWEVTWMHVKKCTWSHVKFSTWFHMTSRSFKWENIYFFEIGGEIGVDVGEGVTGPDRQMHDGGAHQRRHLLGTPHFAVWPPKSIAKMVQKFLVPIKSLNSAHSDFISRWKNWD